MSLSPSDVQQAIYVLNEMKAEQENLSKDTGFVAYNRADHASVDMRKSDALGKVDALNKVIGMLNVRLFGLRASAGGGSGSGKFGLWPGTSMQL